MENTPSSPVDVSKVAHLIAGIVSTERGCAREHAARVAVRRNTPPKNRADERQFFYHAAEMLSATSEVEKWSPLLTALQNYEVHEPGKERELLLVWIPVYEAVQVYKQARFRALGGRRLAQLAERPAAHAATESDYAPRSSTEARRATSETDDRAGRLILDGALVAAPTTLFLPPVKPLSGNVPIVQDLLASIQAGSLGVSRPCADPLATGAAPVVNPAATGVQAGALDDSGGGPFECGELVRPVYDRDLLVLTARTLQQAMDNLEALSINRIRSWPTGQAGSEPHAESSVPLSSVMQAAAVSNALDHSATEIKKQLVAVDAPHEDLFIGLEIHLNGPASAYHSAATGSDKEKN